jgi:hypothetical protein
MTSVSTGKEESSSSVVVVYLCKDVKIKIKRTQL